MLAVAGEPREAGICPSRPLPLENGDLMHSHHSRFLQAADVLLYMACRCESQPASPGGKFHEQRLRGLWETIKAGTDVKIQRWP